MIWPEAIRAKLRENIGIAPVGLKVQTALDLIEPDVAELLAAISAAQQTLAFCIEKTPSPPSGAFGHYVLMNRDEACVLENLLDTVLEKWERAEPGAST